jgi:hypothetical protein
MKTDKELLAEIRTIAPLFKERGPQDPAYLQKLEEIYNKLNDAERERFLFLVAAN